MNACLECAVKHITMASIQYDEYRQSPSDNATDLINCIGNLGCAELHLLDEYPDLCSACREIRKCIIANNEVQRDLFDSLVISVCQTANLFHVEPNLDEKRDEDSTRLD